MDNFWFDIFTAFLFSFAKGLAKGFSKTLGKKLAEKFFKNKKATLTSEKRNQKGSNSKPSKH